MRKLPVIRSIQEVYSGVFSHFFQLLRMAWLPLAIWLGLSLVGSFWFGGGSYTPEELAALMAGEIDPAVIERVQTETNAMVPYLLALTIIQYMILSVAAVGFHRFVLLGEAERGWIGSGLTFGRSEFLYIWSIVKIGIIYALVLVGVSLLVGGVTGIIGGHLERIGTASESIVILAISAVLLFLIVILPVIARLSLVLPHVAVGNLSRIGDVWEATTGNGLRLVAYFLSVVLTVSGGSFILIAAISAILGFEVIPSVEGIIQRANDPRWIFMSFVISVPFTLVWTMLTITMLSVAYREIVGLPENTSPEAFVDRRTNPPA